MALSQAQWFTKLKKWVPSWYFGENAPFAPAVWQGIAAVFAQIQQDSDDAQLQTFILPSTAPIDDLHGDERTLPRLAAELDPHYNIRIQNCLFRAVGNAQLDDVVDAEIFAGDPFFIENEQYGFFDDPDLTAAPGFMYYDDYYTRWIDLRKWYNWWTLVIPDQSGTPDIVALHAAIVNAIETNKALGTTYDILDETPSGFAYMGGEDGLIIGTEDGAGIII